MNKTLKKLRIRNIQANFKQFLSVILIVFLSVTLLSGFLVNSNTLQNSIDTYFEESNLADLWVCTDQITQDDENFYISNLIESDKRLYFETNAKIMQKNAENSAKIYVSDGRISKYYLESGDKGCLIDKNIAKSIDAEIGYDKLSFTFNYPFNGTIVPIELDFKITGTMSYVECADTYTSWPVAISENVFLQKLNNEISSLGINQTLTEVPFNQIVIKTDNVSKTSEMIKNYYATSESNLLYVIDRNFIESVVLLNSEVEQSQKMIYVFPMIFLIVSILVILTTINQLIIQEKTKIGTLKSVGVPDKKILNHYSGYGAYLCAIGAVLGLVAGPVIVPGVMFVKYDLLYSIPREYVSLSFPWWLLLLTLVGMVLLGFLVSFAACFEILHKKPIECLKQNINIKMKSRGKSSRIKKLPISIKMALRNVRIKPIRTVMATIGIAGCFALLVCGFGIADTLNYSLNNDMGKVFTYDISTTYTSETFEEDVLKVSGVGAVEKFLEYHAEAENEKTRKNISVYVLSQNSNFSSIKLEGDEVCMTKAIADEFGLKVGDSVTFTVGGKAVSLVVSSLKKTSFFNGVFVCKDLGLDLTLASKGMWIETDGNENNIVEEINKINGTNTAKTMQGFREMAENKISSINLMTTTLKVFAILLAIVVLLNLVFLILKERIKEIATMKVLGENLTSITLALILEILIMSAFGMILGAGLGYPLLIFVLSINKVEVMNYLYHINAMSFVFSALIICVTIFIVSIVSAIKIKNVNMIESLKSVE